MPLTVGQQTAIDGAAIQQRGGKKGELVISDMTGQYYEQTMRGRMFIYNVASQALLMSATTGGDATIITPAGSGLIFIPVSLVVGFISGTAVIGSANIATTLNAGSG